MNCAEKAGGLRSILITRTSTSRKANGGYSGVTTLEPRSLNITTLQREFGIASAWMPSPAAEIGRVAKKKRLWFFKVIEDMPPEVRRLAVMAVAPHRRPGCVPGGRRERLRENYNKQIPRVLDPSALARFGISSLLFP
jgi:hypothetical protein